MEYLIAHKTHPSADEIFSALYPSIPTLSRTTIYNTLNTLAEQGAIRALDIDPRQLHYDGDTVPHGHFLCMSCGMIEDIAFDVPKFEELTRNRAPKGAAVRSVQVTYKGICSRCNIENNDYRPYLTTD